MTRRGRLVAVSVACATALTLAITPMRMGALAVLAVWALLVFLAVIIAAQIDEISWRHERRSMYSRRTRGDR
jgi:hypothetical protein